MGVGCTSIERSFLSIPLILDVGKLFLLFLTNVLVIYLDLGNFKEMFT